MITLDRVTKYYSTPLGRHYVLRNVSMVVPLGRNIGVIGRNGAGKSTLLRLMAGVDYPDKGRIYRVGRYSWPLALAGRGIQGNMTGRENVVFAARIHGLRRDEIRDMVNRVEKFAEIAEFFDMPVNTYSSGMRARLSFSIAMLFEFDCYFIDELNAVGDARFRRITKEYFSDKRKSATFIQVSHDLDELHKICDAGILVDAGQATYFEHVDDALRAYREIMGEPEGPESSRDEQPDIRASLDRVPAGPETNRRVRRLRSQVRKRLRGRAKSAPRDATAVWTAAALAERPADGKPPAGGGKGRQRSPQRAGKRRQQLRRQGPKSALLGLSPSRQLALQAKTKPRRKSSKPSRGKPGE
jgi:capsular polysaccharide transport system ATP-binding protein